MKNKIYAVVEESADRGFIQLIGVFDDASKAYGEAVLYLSELADKDNYISPAERLDGDTGCYIELVNKDFNPITTLFILWGNGKDVQTDTSGIKA